MITDDERRKVAAKMREVAESNKDNLNDDPDYSPFTAFNVFCSAFDRFPRYQDLLHLADLIDRPTTTRHGKFKTKYGRETPCCEVCGYSIGNMRWNYCPKCGSVITDAK
nr:MAG TPA: ribosome, girodazole, girolline, antibiotic complex, 50S [Caudoviricetes sp.]